MARIRTIKPEFWDSPSVAKASPWARLLYIAMWNWADDYGRGTANLKELEGFAFPNDDTFTDIHGNTVHFRDLVAEVSEVFGVLFYEVEGRPFFLIPSWDKHQRNERRAKASKFPDPPPQTTPDLHVAEKRGNTVQQSDAVAETPRSSGPGTGEQGNRGTGEQGNSSSSSGAADAPPTETRDDITEILDLLDDAITQSGFDKPNRTKTNLDAARLLIDKDQRTLPEIRAAINYLPSDEFWRTNIRSMSKLREKWEQLKGSAQRQQSRRANQYRNQNQIVQDMQVRATQQTTMQQASARALIEGAA